MTLIAIFVGIVSIFGVVSDKQEQKRQAALMERKQISAVYPKDIDSAEIDLNDVDPLDYGNME